MLGPASHPTGVRGLKHIEGCGVTIPTMSHHRGAWIETIQYEMDPEGNRRTPQGAWIETVSGARAKTHHGVAPHRGAG